MNDVLKVNKLIKHEIKTHKIKPGLSRVAGIKNMIAVTAGKGGVGKSTVAVNLAVSLAKNGAKVGLFDCDLYGPSVPILMGEQDYKPGVQDNLFVPLDKYGIKVMSFGFLVAANQPVIWRGAMVNKAIDQMLLDSKWGELDYLIVDMPPGTGDIHLTMSQKMPLTATIVVTTPQDIALLDVTKSIEMFNKLGIPCIGIVENMAIHICEKCGNQTHLFGSGASNTLIAHYHYSLLAQLPLDINICRHSDSGKPIALENNQIADTYIQLAQNVEDNLAKLPLDYSSKLSTIPLVKQP